MTLVHILHRKPSLSDPCKLIKRNRFRQIIFELVVIA